MTNQGGFKSKKVPQKVVTYWPREDKQKCCLIRLFNKYNMLCPTDRPEDAFYLKPFRVLPIVTIMQEYASHTSVHTHKLHEPALIITNNIINMNNNKNQRGGHCESAAMPKSKGRRVGNALASRWKPYNEIERGRNECGKYYNYFMIISM